MVNKGLLSISDIDLYYFHFPQVERTPRQNSKKLTSTD